MQPRLKTSKKWTTFPPELELQIISTLEEAFPLQTKNGQFIVQSRIYPAEVLLRLGFIERGRLVQINAECSIEYDVKKENAKKTIHLAIDACASLLENYFSQPEEDYPRSWKDYEVDKKTLFLQLSTVNTELEAQADKLLSTNGDRTLVEGEDYEQELEAIKQVFDDKD